MLISSHYKTGAKAIKSMSFGNFQNYPGSDLPWSRDHPPSVAIALTVGCPVMIAPNKAILCEQDGAIEMSQILAGRKRASCSVSNQISPKGLESGQKGAHRDGRNSTKNNPEYDRTRCH